MAINQTITDIPTPPSSTDSANFRVRADNFMASLDNLAAELNTYKDEANTLETNVNDKEQSTQDAATIAHVAANFKGAWDSATAYTHPSAVIYNGVFYISLQDSTNQDPTTATAYWDVVKDQANSLHIVGSGLPNEAYTKGDIDNGLALSAGSIITMSHSTVPNGFLECNGAELSRTTYADLYAVLGDTYGAGDGSTTFNIPDLRGEFIRGFDNGRGIDSGRAIGTAQGDAIRNITGSHEEWASRGDQQFNASGAFTHSTGTLTGLSASSSGTTTKWTFDASIVVPTASENRPRNIAMMYCIKY